MDIIRTADMDELELHTMYAALAYRETYLREVLEDNGKNYDSDRLADAKWQFPLVKAWRSQVGEAILP